MFKVDVFSLLGRTSGDPLIRKLLDDCKIRENPTIEEGQIESRFAVKEFGLDLNFVPAQVFDQASSPTKLVLSNILFFGSEHAKYGYSIFSESLPLGLTFEMNCDQASGALGVPSKTWESDGFVKSQRWDLKERHVLVQYSKQSKAIKSIEAAIPKEGK